MTSLNTTCNIGIDISKKILERTMSKYVPIRNMKRVRRPIWMNKADYSFIQKKKRLQRTNMETRIILSIIHF